MSRFTKPLFLISIFLSIPGLMFSGERLSRLLVSIDPESSFSPEAFAKASSATLLKIDPRNPYKVVQEVFLDEPFVVLSQPLTERDYGWGSSVLEHMAERYGYRYVVFKEETLEESVQIAEHLLVVNPKYSSELVQLTLEESTRLYALMEKIDDVLNSNGVKYWAGRETLLGAIRHGGLIPWDDYLHLFILDRDEAKLTAAKIAFEELGLILHPYSKDFYKVCERDGLPLEDYYNHTGILPFTYPAANIFVMTLEKRKEIEDVYVHRSFNFYFNWNHERFDYAQIENVERVPFGPITISVPKFPELTLNRMFGTPKKPDLWKTHAMELLWDHRKEYEPLNRGALLVEIDNFNAAP